MENEKNNDRIVPRRSLLQGALGVGALAVTGSSLVDTQSGSAATLAERSLGNPVKGGTLSVAIQGSTSAFSVLNEQTLFDATVELNAFDALTRLLDGKIVYQAAESMTPNSNATVWTINVRQGMKFHDGTPVTAADVVYSLQQICNPKISGLAALYTDVNVSGIQAVGDNQVTVPLTAPRSDAVGTFLNPLIIPAGTTDFTNAVGSGPFVLESYTSTGATMTANPNYWGGAPYLNAINISNIIDAESRYSAVQAGEINYAVGIPASSAASAKSNGMTVVQMPLYASIILEFIMNPSVKPFNNPKVREAMRLALNREQLFKSALFSRGAVAYDVPGIDYPGYDAQLAHTIRSEYNPAKAKKLFKEAGVKQLTIRTSDIGAVPGLVSGSELFAEQLKAVGVKLHLDMIPSADWFSNFSLILSAPLQVNAVANQTLAAVIGNYTGKTAYLPLGNPTDPAYESLLGSAQAVTNPTRQRQRYYQVASKLVQDGGHIMWGFGTPLNAQNVALVNVKYGYGGIMDLSKAWMK